MLQEAWTDYVLMEQGLMHLTYAEYQEMDARGVDDIALISRIVGQYRESQKQMNKVRGETLGQE